MENWNYHVKIVRENIITARQSIFTIIMAWISNMKAKKKIECFSYCIGHSSCDYNRSHCSLQFFVFFLFSISPLCDKRSELLQHIKRSPST